MQQWEPLIGRWGERQGGSEKSFYLTILGTFCLVWRNPNDTVLRFCTFSLAICICYTHRKKKTKKTAQLQNTFLEQFKVDLLNNELQKYTALL